VNDPAGDVLVHLGSSDYLSRYKIYVTHAQGWRAQFQKLDSVDLRYDNQIIVNPDMEGTQPGVKEKPLNPTMAKAAAAAGVKPAALLTRMGTGGKALPKPAFELTKKTLEGKPVTTPNKAAAKPELKAVAKAPAKPVAVKPTGAAGERKLPGEKVAAAKPEKKKAGRATAAHAANEKKKAGAKALPVAVKKPAGSGGKKPSPGIAKNPADEVSD
jgi:hypothetical protein